MPRKDRPIDALELAARHLAGWNGCGQSWFADVRECRIDGEGKSDERGVMAESSGLSIAVRGRVEEQAGAKTAQPVSRQHHWKRVAGRVGIPSHRPCTLAPGALAFAKLSGPLAPLLLLYACEAYGQWPTVARYALACYPHPEAIGDAMRRILWGRRSRLSPPPQDTRARELGIRAATYRQQTRRAETMLRSWLDRAAWSFLLALRDDDENGTAGYRENDLTREGSSARTAPTTTALA
jgi:hypothetical protein